MAKDLTLSIRRDKSRWSGVRVVEMTKEGRGYVFFVYKWRIVNIQVEANYRK